MTAVMNTINKTKSTSIIGVTFGSADDSALGDGCILTSGSVGGEGTTG
jgi:hypothetical protein